MTSPVTVNVVFDVLVGVHGMRVQNPHPDAEGVCHVAVVELVAVRTCPDEGAVALETFISVVADLSTLAVSVFVAPVIVLFVRVSVLDIVGTFTHSTAILHAETRDIVVSALSHTSIVPRMT